ncbi:MAG: DNA polymerase IV [Clostridiaceae bacterium]|nr:DNA polymerase IV [Clostridiaceae bacterium]
MAREILHVDFNNFYASVECLDHPELANVPVVVGGDEEARHGIVLSKNEIAKHRYGVKTGEVLWKVRERCPEVVILRPHMDRYLEYSRLARSLYGEYTDRVEGFGLDEAWLDVTGSGIFGTPDQIADELRERVRREFGITVSVGVSFNKVFAKLGSDMKKPDATTVISESNFRERIWGLNVGDLLYVGPATRVKFARIGINTIGDLAQFDRKLLGSLFGKHGTMLWAFANGLDASPVALESDTGTVKSVGNSTTTPRDLRCERDVKLVLYSIADSVAGRLRENGLAGRTVSVHIRDCDLFAFERQRKINHPTQLSGEIAEIALSLFRENYGWMKPIRSLGIQVSDLTTDTMCEQLDIFGEVCRRAKKGDIERAVDTIRSRYGHDTVLRASMMTEPDITGLHPSPGNFMHTKPIVRS